MNIEAALTDDIGIAGKKLHTGRSRNDQVATDVRLWLRAELAEIGAGLRRLQQALLDLAEREADTIMPGFTHLQTAQPITFGHHMMAWFEMLDRDHGRMADCARRTNVMPLGAAALAGPPADRGGARPGEAPSFRVRLSRWLSGERRSPCRLIPPAKPRPLETPCTSTRSPCCSRPPEPSGPRSRRARRCGVANRWRNGAPRRGHRPNGPQRRSRRRRCPTSPASRSRPAASREETT